MTKAFGYIRVSSAGQLKGDGPGRQEEAITKYAAQHGITLVRFYQDAYTGTEDDRPEMTNMMAEAMSNGTKTVICECLDRLARDLMVQMTLLAQFESAGITLISAVTGEDVTAAMREDPMRRALVQMQGIWAELNCKTLKLRLRKGREKKRAETGRCEGKKPYGHYPGEAAVLERVKELRRKPKGKERRSLARVCQRLNAEGFRNRAGREWKPANLWLIMQRVGID